MNDNLSDIKRYYTCVLWQDISPDSNHLITACKDGRIHVFDIKNTLAAFEDENRFESALLGPIFSFQAHKNAIYAFTQNQQLLISGGKGEIAAWSWMHIMKKQIESPQWTLHIPKGDSIFKPEVNALLISTEESDPFLAAGCGDNMIHIFDMESCKAKQTLKGHTDYINCLALSNDSKTLYSGSEDGSIRIWDIRTHQSVGIIEPHKHQELNRPAFGKYITTITLNSTSEWMISGGGPLMSSWHLRSLSRGIEFDSPTTDSVANIARIHNDLVIAGGSNPYIYVWEMNGRLMSQIPVAASNIFSIAINECKDRTILTVGGASSKINVCSNFKYNDFCFTVK